MKVINIIYTVVIFITLISCNRTNNIIVNKEINLNKNNKYGFKKTIKVKKGEHYDILVQRKGNEQAELVVSNPKYNDYYKSENNYYLIDSTGWETMHMPVYIPYYYRGNKLKIYVWGKSQDVAFKNLKIIKNRNISSAKNKSCLKIYIDSIGINQLLLKREKAFKETILVQEKGDWVDAVIKENNIDIPVQLRLKGDWLDHLHGEKWSFRIRINGNYSWKNMSEFSIQNPNTRSFLNEWTYHKFLEKEDVLTPRYDFIPVYINNVFLGIYAYEEHFTKELLEHYERREGPILKFNEDGMWEVFRDYYKKRECFNYFDAAEIDAFKTKKIKKDPQLSRWYLQGFNLMQNFKEGNKKVSDIFNIEKMAKYFAITSLFNAEHSIYWHNLRFYFNPLSFELEPIPFDGYGREVNIPFPNIIIGFDDNLKEKCLKKEEFVVYNIFNDKEFIRTYLFYLEKYISTDYINNFISGLQEEIKTKEKMIQDDYILYSYNFDFLPNSAKNLTSELNNYKTKFLNDEQTKFCLDIPEKECDCQDLLPTKLNTLKAYFIENNINEHEIEVNNYHCDKIILLGTGNLNIINYFNEPIILEAYDYNKGPGKKIITFNGKHEKLFYKSQGGDILYSEKIQDQIQKLKNSKKELLSNLSLNEPYLNIDNNFITFNKGKYKIRKNLVFPEGYKIIINSGTNLDFTNGSLFYSNSPVEIKGDINNKIKITSSDNSARGFFINQAETKSLIENAEFSGFNSFNYNDWILTGAITFYKSDVVLRNVKIYKNHSEDAINIINSYYEAYNCTFLDIASDAFDSDFSNGIINDFKFENIKNDAIDCSGGNVQINNSKIYNGGDKGISVGENSSIKVYNTEINNVYLAIASKDLSTIEISNSQIDNCTFGLSAFIKKPEYGPANIITKNVKIQNTSVIYLIEEYSNLNYNGKIIKNKSKNIAVTFY